MHEFVAPSGKKVVITPAPFEDAMALKAAIGKEVALSSIKIDIDLSDLGSKEEGKNFFEKDFDVASIAKLAMLIDSSKEINDCLFACLVRCTRDSSKISRDTFEEVEARADYYPIALACIKANLLPFFKDLLSALSPLMKAMGERAGTKIEKDQK